jgi:hypothetical protein
MRDDPVQEKITSARGNWITNMPAPRSVSPAAKEPGAMGLSQPWEGRSHACFVASRSLLSSLLAWLRVADANGNSAAGG